MYRSAIATTTCYCTVSMKHVTFRLFDASVISAVIGGERARRRRGRYKLYLFLDLDLSTVRVHFDTSTCCIPSQVAHIPS